MTGRYHKGRAYVSAGVMLAQLNLYDEVEFMLETGADVSMLSPPDPLRLACDLGDDVPCVPLNSWAGRMEGELNREDDVRLAGTGTPRPTGRSGLTAASLLRLSASLFLIRFLVALDHPR